MRPLFIFLAVVVVGIAASKCSSTSTPTTTAASSTSDSAASSQPASAKPTWQYTSWTDKMTGNSGSVAWIQSENTFSLEFPYQGAQHADLRMSEAGIVSIDIKQGQFGCHRSCSVLVKFDDEKPQYYNFHESGPKGESLTV